MVMMMPGQDPTAERIWRVVDSLEQGADSTRWKQLGREAHMFAAVALVRAGLSDSARRVMARVRRESPRDDPSGALLAFEALVLAQLGDRAQAVEALERYANEHPEHIAGFKKADFWWWRPLQDEPGFKRILALASQR